MSNIENGRAAAAAGPKGTSHEGHRRPGRPARARRTHRATCHARTARATARAAGTAQPTVNPSRIKPVIIGVHRASVGPRDRRSEGGVSPRSVDRSERYLPHHDGTHGGAVGFAQRSPRGDVIRSSKGILPTTSASDSRATRCCPVWPLAASRIRDAGTWPGRPSRVNPRRRKRRIRQDQVARVREVIRKPGSTGVRPGSSEYLRRRRAGQVARWSRGSGGRQRAGCASTGSAHRRSLRSSTPLFGATGWAFGGGHSAGPENRCRRAASAATMRVRPPNRGAKAAVLVVAVPARAPARNRYLTTAVPQPGVTKWPRRRRRSWARSWSSGRS